MSFTQDRIIVIPWSKVDRVNQIKDIPLTKIWVDKLGFKAHEGSLYMLPLKEYWYEQTFKANEYSVVIKVKFEKGEWGIVIPKLKHVLDVVLKVCLLCVLFKIRLELNMGLSCLKKYMIISSES